MTRAPGDDGQTVVEAAAAKPLQVGSLLSDRYRLDKELGRGAMGAVFEAQHTLMRKTVAIKVLHADTRQHEGMVERFQREAQAVAQIDHPNVCAALDFGVAESGERFLVMEHLAGRDLSVVLEQDGPLPAARAIPVFRQIASALERCHSLGIVHRDLKPENVMLVAGRAGEHDRVKLLDFGIAAIQQSGGDPKLTAAGMTLGTPHYMSPEQATASDLDGRADLYSVGVMLFEALTGRTPFDHDDNVQLLTMHVRDVAPTMASAAPTAAIPAALERIVARLLEKLPEARYQSAGELEQALAEAAQQAPRPSAPAPRRRSAGAAVPRQLWVVGAGVALVLLIVLIALSSGGGSDAPAKDALTAAQEASPSTAGLVPAATEPPAVPVGEAAPTGQDAKGLQVLEHVIARRLNGRTPEGVAELFGPDTTKVYCHLTLDNRPGPRRKLALVWYHQGREHYRFPIKVGQSPKWRTYGVMKLTPEKVGAWRCDLINEDGVVLSSAPFGVGAGL